MIIMALDHVRDNFHADVKMFDPEDLEQTNVLLFFTRVDHSFLCTFFYFKKQKATAAPC